MNKKLIGIFVCMLMFTTTLSIAEKANLNGTTIIYDTHSFTTSNTNNPGDILFVYDVETPTEDNQCLGIEFDGTYYYVTGGGGQVNNFVNKIHIFQADGTYVASIDQPTSGEWGWRDIVYDGNHMYSSEDQMITEWYVDGLPDNPVINVVDSFEGPIRKVNRGLAYDPATDHFWTANFASSIYEFDRNGNVINTFDNGYSIFGMAWDNVSPDGPWLWMYCLEGEQNTQIYQFDPINGIYTGVTFQGYNHEYYESLAGGACFVENENNEGILVCLTQDDLDLIFGMYVAKRNQPPNPPSIDGSSAGTPETTYSYDFYMSDPDENNLLELEIDFGDGGEIVHPTPPENGWLSGSTEAVEHSWDEEGTYTVSARVMDEHGTWGEWGTLEVAMPNNNNLLVNPEPGHLYASFTNSNGKSMWFFGNLIVFIFCDVEVTAQSSEADEVEFILTHSKDGEIARETVTSIDDTFSYNFGKPSIGFYTIKANAYKNGDIIESKSIEKVFSLSP